MEQSIFRDEKGDCPIVYLAGTLISIGSKPSARYGVCWGAGHAKNEGGPVAGSQTSLRAELTALRRTLEIALAEDITKLIIVFPSKMLGEQLEVWERRPEQHASFENSDILYRVEQLFGEAEARMYFSIDLPTPPDPRAHGYTKALQLARTMLVASRISRNSQITTVAIFAICEKEGKCDALAKYGVYWGQDDHRNEAGLVEDGQTSLRAIMCAVRSALRTAAMHGLKRVHFLTRRIDIINIIKKLAKGEEEDSPGKRNGAIFSDCSRLRSELLDISVKLVQKDVPCVELDRAEAITRGATKKLKKRDNEYERLDRQLLMIESSSSASSPESQPKIENIGDKCPTAVILNLLVRPKFGHSKVSYAVYWGENDEKNERGPVNMRAHAFQADLYAAMCALKKARSKNIRKLHLLTTSEYFKNWMENVQKKNELINDRYDVMMEFQLLLQNFESVTIEVVNSSTQGARRKMYEDAQTFFAGRNESIQKQRSIEDIQLEDPIENNIVEAESVNPESSNQIQVVYVGGACRGRGYANALAVYSVVWPIGEYGCSQGPVTGIVNNIRAKLAAVKSALQQAEQLGIASLIIRTNDQMVHDTLILQNSPIGNIDLMDDIESYKSRMRFVAYQLTTGDYARGNVVADRLAEVIVESIF